MGGLISWPSPAAFPTQPAAFHQKPPLFPGPLHGERARLEPLTVRELFVLPELRLDAVRPVVAQLDETAIVSVEELEEPLPGLPRPRRRGRSVGRQKASSVKRDIDRKRARGSPT